MTTENLANIDADYVNISLPSNFHFYDFKTLSIRPLKAKEILKIYKASRTNSFLMLVQAIAPCIDKDIMKLTIGDFWSVMYWLKLNSFTKSPIQVTWECRDEKHIEQVNAGTLEPKSLNNHDIINKTLIEEVQLDTDKLDAALLSLGVISRFKLNPSTIGDTCEAVDLMDAKVIEENDDFFTKYAAHLHPDHGIKLKDRYDKALDELTPDDMIDIDVYADLIKHGINEQVKVKCKECGALREVAISLNALDFLPYIR